MTRLRLASVLLPLALGALAAVACGGKASTTDGGADGTGGSESNDGQAGSECTTNAECGSLECLCGRCESPCEGAEDCALPSGSRCVGDPIDTSVAEAGTAFELRKDNARGRDMVLGPDSSVFVVGGKPPEVLNSANITAEDFWIAAVDAKGHFIWQGHETVPENESSGTSVTLDSNGTLYTLATAYAEGQRTHVRKFDTLGSRTADYAISPELTIVRALPKQPGAWWGGAELVDQTDGRAFTRAYVERSGSDATDGWPASFAGLTGSLSGLVDMAVDGTSNLSLSGFLGTDTESNRSLPWVARLDGHGRVIFQTSIAVSEDTHCSADAVATTVSDVTLAAGNCEGNWLKAFSPKGKLLWERRFPRPVTAVAALETGGYFVATGVAADGGLGGPEVDERAELLAFDAEHHLLYRVSKDGCSPFHRLRLMADGVLVLGDCSGDLLLAKYQPPWYQAP